MGSLAAKPFLNIKVGKAQKELDDKVIEAKDFDARDRGAQAQVVADMATLSGYIATLMGQDSEATTCLTETNDQIADKRYHRNNAKKAYEDEYAINYADRIVKQNDFDVLDFFIKTTKDICDARKGSLIELGCSPELQVCSSQEGETLRFVDVALQQRFDKLVAKGSQDLLRGALTRGQRPKQGPR